MFKSDTLNRRRDVCWWLCVRHHHEAGVWVSRNGCGHEGEMNRGQRCELALSFHHGSKRRIHHGYKGVPCQDNKRKVFSKLQKSCSNKEGCSSVPQAPARLRRETYRNNHREEQRKLKRRIRGDQPLQAGMEPLGELGDTAPGHTFVSVSRASWYVSWLTTHCFCQYFKEKNFPVTPFLYQSWAVNAVSIGFLCWLV